jgi:hypothetical protein
VREPFLIWEGFAEVASDQDAHTHKLFVSNSKFLDDKVVIECVDVFVVNDPTYHACASEHEHVRVGGVYGVNSFVPQEFYTGHFGFAGASDERYA